MEIQEEKKQLIQEFEGMRDMAELQALSKHSLETPLNEVEFKRMMELKNKLFD